jgi:hypothetical protein
VHVLRGACAARGVALSALLLVVACAPRGASAQALPDGWYEGDSSALEPTPTEPPAATLPGRLVLQAGVGLSVRRVADTNFRQERLAPFFLDVTATWITRSDRHVLRFGPSLEVSTNLSADGPAVRGVRPWTQWVIAPGFTVRLVPSRAPVPRVVIELRPSVPWVVAPQRTWGLAATLGLAVMVRASLGVYLEGTASIVAGGGTRDAVFTRHTLFSFDAGVRLDLERLP